MKKFFLVAIASLLFFSCETLSAGTVRLLNDSPFKLTAVIITANGQQAAQYTLNPQDTVSWIDYTDQPSAGVNLESTWPDTPYTVIWYCLAGDNYSVSSGVPTGGMSTAQTGIGPRFCSPPKKTPKPLPPQPHH